MQPKLVDGAVGPLILVVDDDVDVVDALQDVLIDEGYRVAAAHDGFMAIAYLRSNPPPSLVLLDWTMPRCDGQEFRQLQMADEAIAAIPVVLLTADVRIPENDLRAAGAATNLKKPVDVVDLLAAIEAHRTRP